MDGPIRSSEAMAGFARTALPTLVTSAAYCAAVMCRTDRSGSLYSSHRMPCPA